MAVAVTNIIRSRTENLRRNMAGNQSSRHRANFFRPTARFRNSQNRNQRLTTVLRVISNQRATGGQPRGARQIFRHRPNLNITPYNVRFRTITSSPKVRRRIVSFNITRLNRTLRVGTMRRLAMTLTLLRRDSP